jgi:Leu/Phe-tRNA-protein transferase
MAPNGHQKTATADDEDIQSYIPAYLRHMVHPYHTDFCQTSCFHPRLIVQLMAEGFLPIATRGVLLPKLHQERCVISLPHNLHTKKSVRKKAKNFSLSINTCLDKVVQGCHEQHSNCWLLPPLVAAFTAILTAGGNDAVVEGKNTVRVRMYSIEVWNNNTGTLAAGELGYTVGSMYTSLTGFSREDSSGSVQLAALGKLLCSCGFSIWDLGMAMEYKTDLGAHLMPRAVFVEEVHRVRVACSHLVLPMNGKRVSCKAIVDGSAVTSPGNSIVIVKEANKTTETSVHTKNDVVEPRKKAKLIGLIKRGSSAASKFTERRKSKLERNVI